jgi:hypothetical protein
MRPATALRSARQPRLDPEETARDWPTPTIANALRGVRVHGVPPSQRFRDGTTTAAAYSPIGFDPVDRGLTTTTMNEEPFPCRLDILLAGS